MKKLVLIAATMIGAFILTGCQGTSNSTTPAATTSAYCNYNAALGRYTDQNGNACNPTSTATCATQGLIYQNGVWISPVTGQVVNCNTNGVGIGTGGITNCQQASLIYGVQYATTIINGQTYCINLASYGVTPPPTYNYTTPVYVSTCPYSDPYYCYNGWNNGGVQYVYQPAPSFCNDYYGGGNSISIGFSFGF